MAEKEYIEREKAFDAVFGQFCASSDETEAALNAAIEEIRAIPAADVRSVVRGEWEPIMIPCNDIGDQIQDQDEDFGPLFRCTKCRHAVIGRPNFCPNCGAVMRETGNEKA